MTAPAKQSWRNRARCRTEGDPTWFDDRIEGESDTARTRRHVQARQVCARCPVVNQCFAAARAVGEEGVWGKRLMPAKKSGPPSQRVPMALTDDERRLRANALRTKRRREAKETD